MLLLGTWNGASVTEKLNFYFILINLNVNLKLMMLNLVIGKLSTTLEQPGYVNLLYQLKVLWKLNTSCISGKNFASKLRYAVCVKHTPDFEDSAAKKECKMFPKFIYWLHVEMVILWIYWVKENMLLKLLSPVSFYLF